MNWFKRQLKNLQLHLKLAMARFPETLALTGAFALVAIVLNHLDYGAESHENLRSILENVLMTLALGIPYSGFVVVLSERLKGTQAPSTYGKLPRLIGTALLAAVLVAFYFTIPDPIPELFIWRFSIVMVSGYLAFSLVHFFPKHQHYPLSVLKLIADGAVTTLYTLVIFGGTSAILFALDALLGVNIQGEWYADAFFLLVGFFAPPHFLGAYIKRAEDIEDYMFSRVFKVLFGTIVTVLLLIYTAILYAYFVKMVFDGGLPNGMVTQLVMWYSIVALGTLFLTASLAEESPLVKWFQRFMPILMVLPIAMMFVAIYMRIDEYGITVKRYFVVTLGLWVLGNALYRIFSRQKWAQVMVFSAIAVSLLSLYGPWSAYPVSISNQNARFEALLTDTGLLKDGVIVPNKNLKGADITAIRNTISYFESQHSLEDLRYIPKDFEPATQMETLFGFEYWGGEEANREYLSIWGDEYQGQMDLNGAKAIYFINWTQYGDKTNEASLAQNGYALTKTGDLTWKDTQGKSHTLNLTQVIEDATGQTLGSITLKGDEAWLSPRVDGETIQLFIQNVQAEIDGQGTYNYNHIKLMLFYK